MEMLGIIYKQNSLFILRPKSKPRTFKTWTELTEQGLGEKKINKKYKHKKKHIPGYQEEQIGKLITMDIVWHETSGKSFACLNSF